MLSQKKFITGLSLIIVLLVAAGCTFGGAKGDNVQESEQTEENQPAGDNQFPDPNENFLEANLADLSVGQTVLVLGSENSDGSVSASRVIIGGAEMDFGVFGAGRASSSREQFQNMSDEERQKLREEMMAQGGAFPQQEGVGSMRANNTVQNTTRLTGEILSKNDSGIVLQLKEGGSKIVFISATTVILKNKENNSSDQNEPAE